MRRHRRLRPSDHPRGSRQLPRDRKADASPCDTIRELVAEPVEGFEYSASCPFGMPAPRSLTTIEVLSSSCRLVTSISPPAAAYFSTLENKFPRICSRASRSNSALALAPGVKTIRTPLDSRAALK